MSRTRPHRIWGGMIARCNNSNTPGFKRYGARGIKVCEEWSTFRGFWNDMEKGYSEELSIDRIDNFKGYNKENCRWATRKQQQQNRSTTVWYKGESATDASIRLSGKTGIVSLRLLSGWPINKAFTLSPGTRLKKAKNLYFHKTAKKWHARVCIPIRKTKSLGYFNTRVEAENVINQYLKVNH